MNRITAFIVVAMIAIMVTAGAMRMIDREDSGPCDVHPELSDAQVATMRANIDRARTQAFGAVTSEGKGKDAANKAAEDASFDTFVHDLRASLGVEYLRHRQAMDGCF